MESVLQALDVAADQVASQVGLGLTAPPALVRSYRKQRNKTESHVGDFQPTVLPRTLVTVYEVWAMPLEDDTECFAVVKGVTAVVSGGPSRWQSVDYLGYYLTLGEAINAIGA